MIKNYWLLIVFVICKTLNAAPINGKVTTLLQPDGTKVVTKMYGDEFYVTITTMSGHTLKRNKDRWLCYASLDNDTLKATNEIYNGTDKRSSGKPIYESIDIIKKKLNESSLYQFHKQTIKYKEPIKRNGAFGGTTHIKGLTIVISFKDLPSAVPSYKFENFLNATSYNGYGNSSSIRGYFLNLSSGKLDYTNKVIHYTSKYNASYYHHTLSNDSEAGQRATQKLYFEALNELAKTTPNLFEGLTLTDKYNKYGMSSVKVINFYFAGANSGDWGFGLWPHSYTLIRPPVGQDYFKIGNIYALDYQHTNIGTTNNLDIGTFIHETCHLLLSLPDLYSYNKQLKGDGIHRWDPMSAQGDKAPGMLNPYHRMLLGWYKGIDIETLVKGKIYKDIANDNQGYYIKSKHSVHNHDFPTIGNGPAYEYYFLESRRNRNVNAEQPGSGLLIYHIDEAGDNTNRFVSSGNRKVMLVQADDKHDLEEHVITKWSQLGDIYDPFYKEINSSFNNIGNLKANWYNGSYSGLDIRNISSIADEMTFSLGQLIDSIPEVADTGKEVSGVIQWFKATDDHSSKAHLNIFDSELHISLNKGVTTHNMPPYTFVYGILKSSLKNISKIVITYKSTSNYYCLLPTMSDLQEKKGFYSLLPNTNNNYRTITKTLNDFQRPLWMDDLVDTLETFDSSGTLILKDSLVTRGNNILDGYSTATEEINSFLSSINVLGFTLGNFENSIPSNGNINISSIRVYGYSGASGSMKDLEAVPDSAITILDSASIDTVGIIELDSVIIQIDSVTGDTLIRTKVILVDTLGVKIDTLWDEDCFNKGLTGQFSYNKDYYDDDNICEVIDIDTFYVVDSLVRWDTTFAKKVSIYNSDKVKSNYVTIIYPNINIFLSNSGDYEVSLYTINGRLLYKKRLDLKTGYNSIVLNNNIAPCVLLLTLKGELINYNTRIVLK